MISVCMASIVIGIVSVSAFGKSFSEMRQVERELSRVRSYAAAEAGLQSALAQISVNAYTGFINTNSIDVSDFQDVDGDNVGSFSVTMTYPNQADWVIVESTGDVETERRGLEGRVFLDSNLSKYLVYADSTSFGSGNNAQYGNPDSTDEDGDGVPDYPELVPPNEDDRAALYFTGDWVLSGANVTLYGDAHAEDEIRATGSGDINGDTYAADYDEGVNGVTDSGVSGNVTVGDGFDDDEDRNGDIVVDAADYPDYHDLTATGEDDSHAVETLVTIDHNFYANNNDMPSFVGSSSQNRYLEFVAAGSTTNIVEYNNDQYEMTVGTYTMPSSAIVYVKGDIFVKGEIEGRITVVSTDDIYLAGDISYANGQNYADSDHSTAFLAKDKLYFLADRMETSGILYAENSSNSSRCFDANYNTALDYDPTSKEYLRLYGNRVINGSTNLSRYDDRIYGYDGNLKYYRPPGIPVVPDLRLVREMDPPASGP